MDEGESSCSFIGPEYATFKGSRMPVDVKLNFRLVGGALFYRNLKDAKKAHNELEADSCSVGSAEATGGKFFIRKVGLRLKLRELRNVAMRQWRWTMAQKLISTNWLVCGPCHLPRPCSGPVINAQLWRFRRCNLISEEASVVVGAFLVGKPRLSKST